MNVLERRLSILLLCCLAAPVAARADRGSAAAAVINGQVTDSIASTPIHEPPFQTLDDRALAVTVNGTDLSTTANRNGIFTFTGVPVGTAQLTFSRRGTKAWVIIHGIGEGDTIDLKVTLNGSVARVDSEYHSKPDRRGELSGRVTSIDAPARTIRIGDRVVSVPTTATIRHGSRMLTFSALAVGDQVEVRGASNGTSSVATEIKVELEEKSSALQEN